MELSINSVNCKHKMVKKYLFELSNHFTTVVKNGAYHVPTTKLAQCNFKFNCWIMYTHIGCITLYWTYFIWTAALNFSAILPSLCSRSKAGFCFDMMYIWWCTIFYYLPHYNIKPVSTVAMNPIFLSSSCRSIIREFDSMHQRMSAFTGKYEHITWVHSSYQT